MSVWLVVPGLRPRTAGGLGALACALFVMVGCASRAERWLSQRAPDVPRPLIQLLVRDDQAAFADYCQQAGIQRLLQAHTDLVSAARDSDPARSGARLRRLAPYLERLADQLTRTYAYPASAELDAWLRTLNDRQVDRWLDVRAQQRALLDTRSADPQQGQARALDLQAQFETLGYRAAKANLLGYVADLWGTQGDIAQQYMWAQRAVAAARATRMWTPLCQYLGVLGAIHEVRAEPDSMASCWNEALALAQRMRHAEQAGRITSFYADHFDRQGRLGLAQQWFEESARLCREYRGEAIEARYVVSAARFYAQLGCWEIVERHLQRVRKLLDDPQVLASPTWVRLHRFDADLLEARRQLALGNVDEGDRLFGALARSLEAICAYCDRWSGLHRYWAEGLVAQGRAQRAQAVAQQALAVAQGHGATALQARLWLVMARAALAAGSPDTCLQHLSRFAALAREQDEWARRPWVEHDALAVRAYQAAGDSAQARVALAAGLERLRTMVRGIDASPAGYLFLDSCRELRLAGHALWQGDAARSFAFERQWRALGEQLTPARAPAKPATWDPSNGALAHRANLAIALQYLLTNDDVVRWTSTSAGLRVEKLGLDPHALTQRIVSLVQQLQGDHRDALAALQHDLRALAAQLLPPEVLQPPPASGERPLVSIAADGALALLPFATLPIGQDPARCLVEAFDVVTERGLPPVTGRASAGPAVVVADPRAPEALRVQQRLEELPQGAAEGQRWAAAQRNVLVLADSAATRQRLLGVWQQAGSLYFATHVVQNPEIPYLQFIPMAGDGVHDPGAEVLDVADIRQADLSGCRLVVLSACESGARYLAGQAQAPSLAEAFLDAGADVVIHTLWPVRDEAAVRIMDDFAGAWSAHAQDAVVALNATLRACAARVQSATADDPRPLEWAAYGVEVRGGAYHAPRALGDSVQIR